MTDVTQFFFGLVLWLGSSGIIVLLQLYQNDPKTKIKAKSTSPGQDALLSTKKQPKKGELELAGEKITALQNELELTLNQFESSQYNYAQLEAKLQQQSQEFEAQIINLQQQCQRLRSELEEQSHQIDSELKHSTFEQIQSLLTNYPTAKVMVKVKPDLPAKNLISLLKPLDNLLAYWQIETIGKPWEKVPYNPKLHRADQPDIGEGELVYIRFVGYRQGDRILTPAKVSLTLPGKKND
jgi:molecular chaperone GrpE (heat shock protein)